VAYIDDVQLFELPAEEPVAKAAGIASQPAAR